MPVFAFGSNGSGQLGIGHGDDVSAPARHIPPSNLVSDKLVQFAAGGNHSLILYESGQLTQTSAGSCSSSNGNCNTEILAEDVRHCSATWDASIYYTHDHRLIACGKGPKGELGLGYNITEAPKPGLIIEFSLPNTPVNCVIDLASGVQHSVAVLSNGEVIGWGSGRKGQLGQPAELLWKPRKIEGIPFKVKRAVCGREFTYLVGDQGEGQHLVLGSDKWRVRSGAPEAVKGWKDLKASWGSIYVHFDSGKVISWGRNDHGQLAPTNLPRAERLAAGSEHALIYSNEGKICVWGWGEHGNCGPGADKSGDIKGGTWNEIDLPENGTRLIRGIGAGCATSWLWT